MSDPCPVESYARAVLKGEIITGRPVRLACERHLRDLETGAERGLEFVREASDRAIKFFSYLSLLEGGRGVKPFILQPWQQFIIGSIFGWKAPDGFRRFRTAYIESGKGSGKTPLAGAVCLYGLVADGEQGAEIYAAATTREQANITFRDAKNMAEASRLADKLDIGQHNIAHIPSRSFFRVVSSEHRGLDGKRPHIVAIDEIHEHPDSMVVDKMRAGTKGRRQALIFEITNSGYDRDTVCWHHHDYSLRVLDGREQDDSWFAYVCSLDPCETCRAAGHDQPAEGCANCDSWQDEAVWLKANPNLGVSISLKYLREQVREAVGMPSKQNIVKRLNFSVWTEQSIRWLLMDRWDACASPLEALEGRECFAGLDLASTNDLTALVLLFPDVDNYDLLPLFWVSENTCRERERRNRTRLGDWVRQGWIEETPEARTDYKVIRRRIQQLSGLEPWGDDWKKLRLPGPVVVRIREIAVDPWNADSVLTDLTDDGQHCILFGQGMASMNAPTKEFEALVATGKIRHGGHPVLRWNAGNVAVKQDPAGNIKPDKEKSTEKIDGIVAAIMALGRAMLVPTTGSYYDTHGIDML